MTFTTRLVLTLWHHSTQSSRTDGSLQPTVP